MSVIFRSPGARARIEVWHERFRAKLTTPVASRTVPTAFGETHVLVGGPADAPPLVLLHGAMASSAHVLVELEPLMRDFRVHAVDVLGQSVKSADVRLRVDGDEYGRWLRDVLDGLGLAHVHLVGVSWGGFVAVRLAALDGARIARLALLVPAGLVKTPPWTGFTRMGWPMLKYRLFPSEHRKREFLSNLLTTTTDDWLPYLGEAFDAYRMDMRVPMLARDAELAGFHAPTMVVAADDDASFPGDAVLARAKALFPGLAATELLTGCKHSPPTTPEFRAWLAGRLTSFFAASPDRAVTAA